MRKFFNNGGAFLVAAVFFGISAALQLAVLVLKLLGY